MIDPVTEHDWSEPAGPTKDYVPRCHRCGLSSADKEKAAEKCLGAPLIADQAKVASQNSDRLYYLELLFRNCPHVEITFCDDPDEEGPLGWCIRVQGCETCEVFAPTFRELIDKAIPKLEASSGNPIPHAPKVVAVKYKKTKPEVSSSEQ